MFCRKGRWTYHGTGVEYYQDSLFTEQDKFILVPLQISSSGTALNRLVLNIFYQDIANGLRELRPVYFLNPRLSGRASERKSEGLRFDFSWGLRIFPLSHACDKTKKHLS